jgi:HAD superfamily hydrolase (TIGR01549 family)
VGSVKDVALGFDFDHTLGLDHKLEHTAFVQLVQKDGRATGRRIDAAQAGEIIDRHIAFYRAGKSTLRRAFEAAYEAVAGTIASNEGFEEFKALALSLAPEFVTALPGVPEMLASLDDRAVPYAILTNGWNPLQQRKASLIGFARPVFVSDDIGVRKPSVHAFNVLKDYFSLPPGQVWYVGDDPLLDVVGALGAGMRAVWFDWENKRYPTNVPAPTAIINRIADILNLV